MPPDTKNLNITVVIPTFNRAHLIRRALESVRNQHQCPAQIIVVDDASTDGTPATVRNWAKETGFPVTVEVLKENGGPAKARNRGIELADTEYIAFLDSDDEHLPDTLARLVSPLEYFPDVVLSFADATVFTPSGTDPHGLFRRNIDLESSSEAISMPNLEVYALRDAKTTLLKASMIPTPCTCFRRQAAINAGLMPSDFRSGEDWLFWLRLTSQGRFVFQLDDLVRNHRHDGNLTHPRAAEFVAREKLRGFLALLDGSMRVSLSTDQTEMVKLFRTEALSNWRYHLSCMGLKPYLSGLDSDWLRPLGARTNHLIQDPKSIFRAGYYSIIAGINH